MKKKGKKKKKLFDADLLLDLGGVHHSLGGEDLVHVGDFDLRLGRGLEAKKLPLRLLPLPLRAVSLPQLLPLRLRASASVPAVHRKTIESNVRFSVRISSRFHVNTSLKVSGLFYIPCGRQR